MINTQDLKIGNYVSDEFHSTFIKVGSISDKGINLEIENDGNLPECAKTWIEPNHRIDTLRGIPLTEEILLKCGFIRELYSNFYSNNCISAYSIDNNLIVSFKVCQKTDEVGGLMYYYEFPKIKYLHELQNAFYIFVRKELEITL